MSNFEFYSNDVNGTVETSEGVASGRSPVEQQRNPTIQYNTIQYSLFNEGKWNFNYAC